MQPNIQASGKGGVLARRWRGFWQLADPKVWVASAIPIIVGTATAKGLEGALHGGWLVAVFLGIFLLEIGKNGINEVADYLLGADRYVSPEMRNQFSGGKKTIVDGILSLREVHVIAWTTTGLAAVVGVVIAYYRSPLVLWIGLAGLLAAVFYSQPPVKLAYRGLGGLVVGLTFGPLLTAGAYIVQTKTWAPSALWIGMPLGFLIANVLLINQFPDMEADLAAGKMTGVVRLGRKRSVYVFALLYILCYVSVVALAVGTNHPLFVLALLSVPPAVKSVKIARRHAENIPELLQANEKAVIVYIITGLALAGAALFLP